MSRPPVLPETFYEGVWSRPDGRLVVVASPGSGWLSAGGYGPFMLISETELREAAVMARAARPRRRNVVRNDAGVIVAIEDE